LFVFNQNKKCAIIFVLVFLFITVITGHRALLANPKIIIPTFVEKAPIMNGTLGDPEWKKAAPISDFVQYDPQNGAPPSEKTVVRVLYTRRMVYFGIHCYDNHPDKILATQLIRDGSQAQDDQFLIIIDPTNSGENGYYFAINPLGTKLDALVGEEGNLVDANWNGIWQAEAKIGKDGWTAEIAIPFFTLNFDARDNLWKINFQRVIRRKQEVDLWTSSERIYGIYKLSKAGEIGPFKGIRTTRLRLLKPYAAFSFQRVPQEAFGIFSATGLDYTYGITSNLQAHLTLNPDFFETPPDLEQVNFTPLPLFLHESRSFFLEREDIFNVGVAGTNLLFFSRNIGIDSATGAVIPVREGFKADGSLGHNDVGFLAVQEGGAGFPRTDIELERLKKEFSSGSYLGFLGIQKESQNPSHAFNGTYALDYNLNFLNSALNFQGFLAKTSTTNLNGDDWGGFGLITYQNDWVVVSLFKEMQELNFNPELGFRKFSDDNSLGMNVVFIVRPNWGDIREVHFTSNPAVVKSLTGQPFVSEVTGDIYIIFNSGASLNLSILDPTSWNLSSSFQPFSGLIIPSGHYDTNDHIFTYNSNPTQPFYYTLQYGFGNFYTGPYQLASLSLNWKPNRHFLFNISRTEQDLHLLQGDFRILQETTSFTYAFSRVLNVEFQLQNVNVASPPTTMNARLDWRFKPESDLYLIYNLGPQFISSITGVGELQKLQKFEVKYTEAFF
jgi:hypothetical protein